MLLVSLMTPTTSIGEASLDNADDVGVPETSSEFFVLKRVMVTLCCVSASCVGRKDEGSPDSVVITMCLLVMVVIVESNDSRLVHRSDAESEAS